MFVTEALQLTANSMFSTMKDKTSMSSSKLQLHITAAVIARKCHHKKHIRIYKLLQKQ
jgi:hypothetical protein